MGGFEWRLNWPVTARNDADEVVRDVMRYDRVSGANANTATETR